MNANATSGEESTDTFDQHDVCDEDPIFAASVNPELEGGVTASQDEERPDDCDCSEHFDPDDLGCWPCYRDGFETANPNPIDE